MNTTGKNAGPIVDVNDVSHISEVTVIKGDVTSLTDIRIDGTVAGTVYSRGKLVLGEKAVVTGALLCIQADIFGRMEGDVYVKESLFLRESASVNGSIHVRRFQVEMGARINGSCHMIGEEDFEKFVKDVVTIPLPA